MTPSGWEQRRFEVRHLKIAKDLAGLRAFTTDGRWEVRREALDALADLGAEEAVPLLLEALGDRTDRVKRFAAERLRAMGDAAVPQLLAALHAESAAPAAAVLAAITAGRKALAERDDRGAPLLIQSFSVPGLTIRIRLAATKALYIGRGPDVGDCLAGLLEHESPLLSHSAGRGLWARRDPRALAWVLAQLQYSTDLSMVEWLGELGDARALPALRRLASRWTWRYWQAPLRPAARAAIEQIEERLKHIPDGAVSLAGPEEPTATALSLWQEGETADEAAADG